MKLKKHFKSTGSLISASGLALSVLGILMAQNYLVSADTMATADVDYISTMMFVGVVIIVAGFIVIVLAFLSD